MSSKCLTNQKLWSVFFFGVFSGNTGAHVSKTECSVECHCCRHFPSQTESVRHFTWFCVSQIHANSPQCNLGNSSVFSLHRCFSLLRSCAALPAVSEEQRLRELIDDLLADLVQIYGQDGDIISSDAAPSRSPGTDFGTADSGSTTLKIVSVVTTQVWCAASIAGGNAGEFSVGQVFVQNGTASYATIHFSPSCPGMTQTATLNLVFTTCVPISYWLPCASPAINHTVNHTASHCKVCCATGNVDAAVNRKNSSEQERERYNLDCCHLGLGCHWSGHLQRTKTNAGCRLCACFPFIACVGASTPPGRARSASMHPVKASLQLRHGVHADCALVRIFVSCCVIQPLDCTRMLGSFGFHAHH